MYRRRLYPRWAHSLRMRRFLAIGLLLAVCAAGASGAEPDTPKPLSLPQYIQVLDNALAAARTLKAKPEAFEDLLRRLPPAWHVRVDDKNYEISTETIRRDLVAWQKKPASASLDGVIQHLTTLRYQAATYETPSPDFVARRALLEQILARSEFRNVHGQTWMDRLKQWLTELLFRLLGRAFSSSAFPVISDVIVYGLIVVAVLAVVYWMYRSLREDARLETIMPVPAAVSAKEWPLWIREARAAAERGEWRDAVHLAYWGGISFLEMQGAWRPDVARTPREYLRLLPAASAHQPVLRALTVRLEAVWYGMQSADASAFQETLAELERLGCPCN
jgi:Domain of unknown function (DUF4129)